MTSDFWDYLDELLYSSPLVIDRPRGSHHPRFTEVVYPLDYGYLEKTTSGDGNGIDVWVGSAGHVREPQSECTRPTQQTCLSAIILTVDLHKRDTEVKLLIGCTEEEMQTILRFHNENGMRAMLVRRP